MAWYFQVKEQLNNSRTPWSWYMFSWDPQRLGELSLIILRRQILAAAKSILVDQQQPPTCPPSWIQVTAPSSPTTMHFPLCSCSPFEGQLELRAHLEKRVLVCALPSLPPAVFFPWEKSLWWGRFPLFFWCKALQQNSQVCFCLSRLRTTKALSRADPTKEKF